MCRTRNGWPLPKIRRRAERVKRESVLLKNFRIWPCERPRRICSGYNRCKTGTPGWLRDYVLRKDDLRSHSEVGRKVFLRGPPHSLWPSVILLLQRADFFTSHLTGQGKRDILNAYDKRTQLRGGEMMVTLAHSVEFRLSRVAGQGYGFSLPSRVVQVWGWWCHSFHIGRPVVRSFCS